MNPILTTFALLAGMQAFFAPCSVALIPAYIGYHVREQTYGKNHFQQLILGLKAGVITSLGILSVYSVFGVTIAVLGQFLAVIMPWIELITGSILLFLGSATVLGYEFAIRPPVVFRNRSGGFARYYFFGLAYALSAIGCTLPIFLLVIFQALSQQGILGVLVSFAVYSLTMVTLMIVFSLIAAISKTAISKFLNKYLLLIQKSSGILILFAGIYLVYLALTVIMI